MAKSRLQIMPTRQVKPQISRKSQRKGASNNPSSPLGFDAGLRFAAFLGFGAALGLAAGLAFGLPPKRPRKPRLFALVVRFLAPGLP
ncbi:hypothetical protein RSK20926_10134 [Roseobacter sp. SK209-2-6]|nr:hypothetical protein RSK20926_10134 [Roseobacter sp. SK209-2-6]